MCYMSVARKAADLVDAAVSLVAIGVAVVVTLGLLLGLVFTVAGLH